MWIFQNDSFVSVVAHRDQPGMLLVRSRIKGDIERAVPIAKVFEDPSADYRYRAIVSRKDLQQALAGAIDRIEYGNFKASIGRGDHRRHDAYMDVWQAMARWFGAYVGSRRSDRETGDADIDAFLNDEMSVVPPPSDASPDGP